MVSRCMQHQQAFDYVAYESPPPEILPENGETLPLEEMGNGEILTVGEEIVTT